MRCLLLLRHTSLFLVRWRVHIAWLPHLTTFNELRIRRCGRLPHQLHHFFALHRSLLRSALLRVRTALVDKAASRGQLGHPTTRLMLLLHELLLLVHCAQLLLLMLSDKLLLLLLLLLHQVHLFLSLRLFHSLRGLACCMVH